MPTSATFVSRDLFSPLFLIAYPSHYGRIWKTEEGEIEIQPRTAHDIMGKKTGHTKHDAAIQFMECLYWIFSAKSGREGVIRQ